MSDLSYTTSMVQEIKELLSSARPRAAYGKQTLKELSKELARHIEQYTLLCGYHFLSQNPPCLCSDRIKNG